MTPVFSRVQMLPRGYAPEKEKGKEKVAGCLSSAGI
jgi:hypothetical protein